MYFTSLKRDIPACLQKKKKHPCQGLCDTEINNGMKRVKYVILRSWESATFRVGTGLSEALTRHTQ